MGMVVLLIVLACYGIDEVHIILLGVILRLMCMQVVDEVSSKEQELAALQLKLEMKDQEGQIHKQHIEKLQR